MFQFSTNELVWPVRGNKGVDSVRLLINASISRVRSAQRLVHSEDCAVAFNCLL